MLKRTFDVMASLDGLFLTWPLMLAIAVIIKFTSRGPILYQASRVGKDGKIFRMYKFRTMVINADKMGPAVTGAQDPRITPIGRFLRKTKLDELPQLINVLRGDMSLVGPRPEDPRYVKYYTPDQLQTLKVRPGITSPASVKYRNESTMLEGDNWEQQYIDKIMPVKLALDANYAKKPTVWRDALVLTQTLFAVLQ